jgi:hypothetical protein
LPPQGPDKYGDLVEHDGGRQIPVVRVRQRVQQAVPIGGQEEQREEDAADQEPDPVFLAAFQPDIPFID